MAQKPSSQAAATLKQLTFRISSTPVAELPRVAAQVSASLWACRDLLSYTAPSGKQNSDDGVTVHRFKTQLSALLQDRTVEGRWSAVVLVKATIEAGGLEVLGKANGWVKSLLGFLKKPDPPTTRSLTVITLVRIFMLTWDHANLVREITTPSLPAFISSCLSNVENKRCSASELQVVLEALMTLLPRHPTVFRTHENNIRSILNKIISSTAAPVGQHYLKSHVSAAQKVIVLLHNCAPKQGAPAKWDDTLKSTVAATHATCDHVFRSVIEDWRSVAGIQPSAPAQQIAIAGEAELESPDAIGLSGWKGVHNGSERIIALLGLLQTHLDNATASTAPIRIGLVTDLITRLLSVTVPAAGRQEFVKPNNQISRDERDAMYSTLPRIHIATLQLASSILRRFGTSLASIFPHLKEQLTWVFKAERSDEDFRAAAYSVLGQILTLVGHTYNKDEIADMALFITACCHDMLPEDDHTRLPASTNGAQKSGSLAAAQTEKRTIANAALHNAASSFLPIVLSTLSPVSFPRKLRASIDRTAILTKHKDALVGSVLNPPVNPSGTGAQTSLLPFLARLFPGDPEVEAIIRPRMPVTWTGRRSGAEDEEEEEEDEDDDVDMEETEAQDEPDLLTALDDQLGNGNDASEQDPAPTAVESAAPNTASKRAAPSAPEPAVSAKRLRASPVAEFLAQSTQQELPGPDPATAQAHVPTTVVTRSKKQQPVTLPAQAAPAATANDDDEGSDFEMPPLTMESSGDEDEGEDGEDDEE
ncbi:hypothetical protein Q7P37_005324 [Cladosporium fusiforme]